MRQFRISFTVKGEERMGTILALIMDHAGYSGNLKVEEESSQGRTSNLESEAPRRQNRNSPTPEERRAWAMTYWLTIKEAMGSKTMHYKQIGVIVEKATNKIKASSISSLMSEYTRAGMVQRVGRGSYKVVQ